MAGAELPLRESLRSFAASVDVEAILQETLLRVWQVAPRFEADGRPNGLLRLAVRMGRNLAISEVRRTRAKPVPDEELERGVEPELPGGAPDAELAESLGMRLNTFLQNVTRARKLLAQCLEKQGVTVDPELAS